MIINLLFDYPLRGHTLEHTARILLRRKNMNNFIFVCNMYDSVSELIQKYRLNCKNISQIVDFILQDKWRSDLIEFVLNNTKDRVVERINFFDVKSKVSNSKRKLMDVCLSNHKFMLNAERIGCGAFIVSLILLNNWKFTFEVLSYKALNLRVYDSQRNHAR